MGLKDVIERKLLSRSVSSAPLASFRILFGGLMLFSTIRFAANGWIKEFYVEPSYHFTYFGFEWIQPLSETGMNILFVFMGLFSLMILLGLMYRWSTMGFFLTFSYVELLDKTFYLNHYYFISLVGFIMIFIPANTRLSLDIKLGWTRRRVAVPVLYQNILKFQIMCVYFFAGLAKINADWLLQAQPMKIWLSAHLEKPLIGWLFKFPVTAYFFSWAGMIFDMSISFLLLWRRTRWIGYILVIVFHLITGYLFPIGVFPWVMIALTTVFFSAETHERIVSSLENKFRMNRNNYYPLSASLTITKMLFLGYVCLQLILPFRYVLYPGKLFVHEQGYRFSWRVMLMEKVGFATFWIEDRITGRKIMVRNSDYLSPQQEKMMSTQPDMILQYAHMLKKDYEKKGLNNPIVKVDSYITLNGRKSKKFIDPSTDLGSIEAGFKDKTWVIGR